MTTRTKPRFVKYPRIPDVSECYDIFGHRGYMFEKLDGSISQMRVIDGELYGGSKANFITGRSQRPSWSGDFLRWMHSNTSLYNLPPEIIMFGEWLRPVSVEYPKDYHNKFYFIDLALIQDGKPTFFDYKEAIDYLKNWGVNGVEILDPISRGFFTESEISELVKEKGSFLGDGEMEGIVLKNYSIHKVFPSGEGGFGIEGFAKYLHPKYAEIRKQEQELEKKYLTGVRVKKAVRRLDDGGNQTPTLDELVKEVLDDISKETGKEFSQDAVRGVIRVRNLFHPRNSE